MAQRQRVGLRVQISAPIEFARLLLRIQRQCHRVSRLVEVGRRVVSGEGVHRAQREGVSLVLLDKTAHSTTRRGRATAPGGTVRRFVEEDEGHAFPLGTMDTFATYYAPADFNETANTMALPLYAKQEPRKFDRGTDLHTQANPLPLCHRPQLLVKLEIA